MNAVLNAVKFLEPIGQLSRIGLQYFRRTNLGEAKSPPNLDEGSFRRIAELDGEKIDSLAAFEMLKDENIITVHRCASSLFSFIPSGIFTPISWFLLGQAIRHEYVIVHTDNYAMLIEIGGISPNKCKNDCGTFFKILKVTDKTRKNDKLEEKLTSEKWYTRKMATITGSDLAKIKFSQLLEAINLWITIAKDGDDKKYSLAQRNCKSLARTIRYFVVAEPNFYDVIYSAFGLFSDKPGHVFIHLNAVALDKLVFNGAYYWGENLKKLFNEILKCFEMAWKGQENVQILEI